MDVEDPPLPTRGHSQHLQPAAEADDLRPRGLGGLVTGLRKCRIRLEVLPDHGHRGQPCRLKPGQAASLSAGGEAQHGKGGHAALAAGLKQVQGVAPGAGDEEGDPLHWRAVSTATSAMSWALHPRLRSLAGRASPWSSGPRATAPPRRSVSLYAMLPASRSGKTSTLARPATEEPGALR